ANVTLGGSGGASGNGGSVTVSNNGAVQTAGNHAHGVFRQSIGGGGGSAIVEIAIGAGAVSCTPAVLNLDTAPGTGTAVTAGLSSEGQRGLAYWLAGAGADPLAVAPPPVPATSVTLGANGGV
ncbi:hypothetical protein INQ16_29150, partial [Escherichia coli]|nr:hypothetical protein [Escherichia coli]